MKTLLTTLLVTTAFISTSAQARSISANNKSNCAFNETVTVSINFNGQKNSIKEVREEFEGAESTAKNVAKDLAIEGFYMQSQNYSINPQNYNNSFSGYRFNGNFSYRMNDSKKAIIFMEKLKEKGGINPSLNVNRYRNQPCN